MSSNLNILITGIQSRDQFNIYFRSVLPIIRCDVMLINRWLVSIDNNNSGHLFVTRCEMSDVFEVKLCRITQLVPLVYEL